MAGGKAVNVFKFRLGDTPREVLNWRLWLAVLCFGLMGAARGVDEGLATGTFNSEAFQRQIGIADVGEVELANKKGTISSMVQLGSIAGALLAFVICDRVGRLWATRQLCVLWIIGIIIFMANSGSIEAVYAGRFIAGIGVGETVVVGPVYLSEISPAPIRGLCTCAFTGAVYLGIMLAYFSVYGSEIHIPESYNRWAVPTSVHIMFAGILLILSFFQMESPRHLVRTEQREKALETLCRFRGLPADHPYVQREMTEMEISYHAEKEATLGAGWAGILKEMFLIPNNSYRLLLTNLAQFMACWSGGSAMTVYAPDLFAIVGVTGQEQALLSTAIFGVVKFISSIICALFLVDYAGRKRALIYGITLQLIAMIYIAAFLLVVPVANNPSFTPTPSQSRASTAAIAAIYISGAGWALGWNSGQYLLSSELFPLRIRAICSSITMSIHFANQYAVNRALPNMLLEQGHGLTPSGTFWFFSVITVLGGVWVWLCVPEAAGRSLESIDRLFELRWYRIGLFGRKVAEEFDRVQEELGAEKERSVDGKDDGVRGGC